MLHFTSGGFFVLRSAVRTHFFRVFVFTAAACALYLHILLSFRTINEQKY